METKIIKLQEHLTEVINEVKKSEGKKKKVNDTAALLLEAHDSMTRALSVWTGAARKKVKGEKIDSEEE